MTPIYKAKPIIHTLNSKDTETMFFDNAILLGIIAPIKEYKFCWMVNKETALNFNKCVDIEHNLLKNNRRYTFSIYESKDPFQNYEHFIYANQNDGEYLIPELKNLDFIWLIQNVDVTLFNSMDLVASIRNLNCVNMCQVININLIPSKDRLIF